MPAALLLFIPLLSSLLTSAKNGIKNTAEGKYNRTLGYVLAAVGVYLLVRAINKSKEEAYLQQAGTDKPTQQAQALKTAFNPSGYDWLMGSDFTNVTLVMSTAAQITDFVAVFDAYKAIYQRNLTTDLQTELSASDLEKFWNVVYKRNQVVVSAPSNLVGKGVTATVSVNVRKFDEPNVTDHQAKAGELIGTYVGEATITTNAGKGIYIIVDSSYFLLFKARYYVLKQSVKIA